MLSASLNKIYPQGYSTSGKKRVPAVVRQSSVLGPFLFLIYMNDIVHGINSKIRFFADYTYITVENFKECSKILKRINRIKRCLLTFSSSKTETMTFTRKTIPLEKPSLHINNVTILETDYRKTFRIKFSKRAVNRSYISSKLCVCVCWGGGGGGGNHRSLKYLLSRKTIDFADIIWDNCTL